MPLQTNQLLWKIREMRVIVSHRKAVLHVHYCKLTPLHFKWDKKEDKGGSV